MKKVVYLDYYVSPYHPHPQLYDGKKLMTKQVYLRCKKHGKHLLRYFSLHHDEKGTQEIRCTIPSAFEGHILQQLSTLMNNT